VIDVGGVEEAPGWAPRFVGQIDLATTPGYYVSGRRVREQGIGWPAEEAAMVAQYDPEREVVFIFLREDGGMSSYRGHAPGRLTPPQAYERYKDEL